MTAKRRDTVGVVGGGRWGLALAAAARRAGRPTMLYTRREDPLAQKLEIEVTTDLRALAARTTLVLVAVPSEVVRDVARQLGDVIDGSHYVVHGIRGLSGEGLTLISDVLREETPARRVGALGGPAVADDLVAGNPGVVAVASRFPEVTHAVQGALGSAWVRVSALSDLTGLEWASALNGCLFVAVGFGRAIGASPALLAGLLTRGLHEASRIGAAAGADPTTFFSIAGVGDLMAALGEDSRPEVLFGRAIAEGATLDEARERAGLRIEAPTLLPRVVAFAKERRVEATVFQTMDAALKGTISREEIVHNLMVRSHGH